MEIGNYIRTKDGLIGKIINVEYITPCNAKHRYICKIDATNETWFEEDDIKLEKEELIDLIEKGDYVNGYKIIDIVEAIYYDNKKIFILQDKIENFASSHQIKKYIDNEQIKSIVTKEQFENIEYEVKNGI